MRISMIFKFFGVLSFVFSAYTFVGLVKLIIEEWPITSPIDLTLYFLAGLFIISAVLGWGFWKTKKWAIYATLAIFLLIIFVFIVFRTCGNCTQEDFVSTGSSTEFYVKGTLVVGFNKGVSQAKAEKILNDLDLKFFRTKDVNRGMKFFEETGETFLVKVPEGGELTWIEKIKKIPGVKDAGNYLDPKQILVD